MASEERGAQEAHIELPTRSALISQFHVPVREVDKVTPGVVNFRVESDVQEGTPLRTRGLSREFHTGLVR